MAKMPQKPRAGGVGKPRPAQKRMAPPRPVAPPPQQPQGQPAAPDIAQAILARRQMNG